MCICSHHTLQMIECCTASISTVLHESGLRGILTRQFAGRLLRPVYEDELDRLAALTLAHPEMGRWSHVPTWATPPHWAHSSRGSSTSGA